MPTLPFTEADGSDIDNGMTTTPTRAGPRGAAGRLPLPLTPAAANLKPPAPQSHAPAQPAPEEIGGPKGPEPTRYGDWERKGRCSDF